MADAEKNIYKLMTIMTEAAIENDVLNELVKLGAKGYTSIDARGKGHRGVRNAAWGLSANVRIEVMDTEENVRKMAAAMKERYYRNYAMLIFLHDVEVIPHDDLEGVWE